MTGTAVWPNDVTLDPQELTRDSPHRLICFLLSPFEPRESYDEVHAAVTQACQLCGRSAGIDIECRRADTLNESKPVHDDIWRHIAAADFLVIDITGLNANVMIEYGVAAALRRPHQVILIKYHDDPSRLPFNAFAQRYLPYRRSVLGDQSFIGNLYQSMIQAVTPAPYLQPKPRGAIAKGFKVDLRQGDRPDLILSPSITHRRALSDGVEFGSFYVYRNSWLLLSDSEYRNVRARICFRFQEIVSDEAFISISLRNQHFLANWGHLVLLRANGKIVRTEPENELGKYHDVEVGSLQVFDYKQPTFIDMSVEMNDTELTLRIGAMEEKVAVEHMPYVYPSGKVRVSTSMCRVRLQEIELTPL